MTTAPLHPNIVPHDHPLGQRIGVVGHGGKTTLAKAIARKMDLEFIELDWIANLPGWVRRPRDEFRQIVEERMQKNPNGWVTDHWHEEVVDMIHERADSLIVLAPPFRTMFWRRFKRSIKNSWTGDPVCGGNRETFRQQLLSKDSAILEMWQKRHRYRRLAEDMAAAARPDVDLYLIRSAKELERFYQVQGLKKE